MSPKTIPTDLPFHVFSLEADRDYLLARMISFAGGGFHSRAGFLGQQACEKYMKAFLVQESKSSVQTHKLLKLAEHCSRFNSYFVQDEARNALRNFDRFEQVGRYGAHANFDPLARQRQEVEIAGVMVWSEDYLRDLDAFVFRARGLLDYASVAFDDSLKSILQGNTRSILVGTWTGTPPLFDVLTRKNCHFRD
jgi:HEPN domain-containing protein